MFSASSYGASRTGADRSLESAVELDRKTACRTATALTAIEFAYYAWPRKMRGKLEGGNVKMGTAPPKSERKLMQVPLLDLRRQYAQVRAEILSALERVCDSQQFILGAEVAQFEKEVSATVVVQE